jgi:DNA-binding MarR family transcriptional regulator
LTQVRLLGILRDREAAMSDLREHLGLEKSSVTGLIDRAEARGLVSRTSGHGDGRSVHVKLTAEGAELASRFAGEVYAELARMLESLPEADRRHLVRISEMVLGRQASPLRARALPSPARQAEVERLLEDVGRWASGRADLRGVALVGSWARDAACADSDVDIVLLADRPGTYIEDDGWLAAFGAKPIVDTEQWGCVTERSVALASGLEVEFGVTSPAWASVDPLDAGTRRVTREGLLVLHDPDGLLAALLDAV